MLSFFLKKASLLVLLIIFIERAYEILGKFSQHPTYFDIHFVPQYHASFPALTVCSLKGYKLEVLQVKWQITKKLLMKIQFSLYLLLWIEVYIVVHCMSFRTMVSTESNNTMATRREKISYGKAIRLIWLNNSYLMK